MRKYKSKLTELSISFFCIHKVQYCIVVFQYMVRYLPRWAHSNKQGTFSDGGALLFLGWVQHRYNKFDSL